MSQQIELDLSPALNICNVPIAGGLVGTVNAQIALGPRPTKPRGPCLPTPEFIQTIDLIARRVIWWVGTQDWSWLYREAMRALRRPLLRVCPSGRLSELGR